MNLAPRALVVAHGALLMSRRVFQDHTTRATAASEKG